MVVIENVADLGGLISIMSAMEELAVMLDKVTFRPQFSGYHVVDVDRFLWDLSTRLRAGETIPPTELEGMHFPAQLKGYNKSDVDTFMAEVSERLTLL